PLMQAFVAQRPDNGQWLLTLIKHHIVIDHVSLEIMLGEVAAILGGRAHELPAPIEFRAFVAQALHRVNPEEAEAFFRDQLSDVDETTAPFGIVDSAAAGSTHALEVARTELEPALALRLRETARSMGVSPAVLFHVAWALVVARTSGHDDVVFGTVLSGRMQGDSGISSVLGLFINTLPVRIQLADVSLATLVRNTHHALAALLPHEHAPLALAQRCSSVPAPAPLFTSMLNYRHTAAGLTQDWQGFELVEAEERTNYPLYYSVDDLGSLGFTLIAQACRSIGADRTMNLMQEALRLVANASSINQPAKLISENIVLPESTIASNLMQPYDDGYLVVSEKPPQTRDFGSNTYSASLNNTEEFLASIAADVFSTDNVGRHDNLFSHGADSLSIIRFISRIRKFSGAALPLQLVFDHPYISELASHIEQRIVEIKNPKPNDAHKLSESGKPIIRSLDASPFNSVISIQRGLNPEKSIFCIPGAGANVACFVPLATELGSEFTIYGLQPRGLDGELAPFETVQSAADHHAKAIQIAAPRGRIALIGHSFGGWIAVEIQRLLIAAGREIEPLILLDSSSPESDYAWHHKSEASITIKLISILEKMSEINSRITFDLLENLDSAEQATLLHEFMTSAKLLPQRSPLEVSENLLNVFHANISTRYFNTEKLNGDVVVVFAIDDAEARPMSGWIDHIEHVKFASSHGNHMSLLRYPHAASLADTIKRSWRNIPDLRPTEKSRL
ncbi:alpha/beta fold hydrolase, partial [Burkholderia cepacia]|uniref:alpha/beta fold hydrolase n=1 Tax=Burkholderia cepacia TaxID=292 RepID=UPI0012DA89C3